MTILQNTEGSLLSGILKCSHVSLYCQKNPASSHCPHLAENTSHLLHAKAEHVAPSLHCILAPPQKWEDSPDPAATGLWAGW